MTTVIKYKTLYRLIAASWIANKSDRDIIWQTALEGLMML